MSTSAPAKRPRRPRPARDQDGLIGRAFVRSSKAYLMERGWVQNQKGLMAAASAMPLGLIVRSTATDRAVAGSVVALSR